MAEIAKCAEWWQWTKVVQAFSEMLWAQDKKPSLIKQIMTISQPRKEAELTPAELLVQLSLRKRASAFVDVQDDLETKIGCLTRQLNFLLTESDLWREKFVTFEQYAEKLSSEATDLRVKISKEQQESGSITFNGERPRMSRGSPGPLAAAVVDHGPVFVPSQESHMHHYPLTPPL